MSEEFLEQVRQLGTSEPKPLKERSLRARVRFTVGKLKSRVRRLPGDRRLRKLVKEMRKYPPPQ